MANEQFQRAPGKGKFAYLGIDLKNPPDLMPVGRAPLLLNVTPDELQGALQQRAGTTLINTVAGGAPIHSMQRLNDSLPGASLPWQRFIGAGASLFAGQTTFPALDTGYSGNPLSMVPYRPPMSPETWMYVYDSAKQAKYRVDGTKQNIGIIPPTLAPLTTLGQPLAKPIVDVTTAAGFNGTGICAAPTKVNRVTTTTKYLLFDTGNTGWATVWFDSPSNNIVAGMRLLIGSEVVTVERMFPQLANTTVAGIVYDTGTSGLCTVQPTTPIQGLVKDQWLFFGTNAENARVISVTEGPDGAYSFRVFLIPPVPPVVPGTAIFNVASARIYFTQVHPTGSSGTGAESVTEDVLQSVCTGAGSGMVTKTGLTLDLTSVNNVPLTTDDYMHISFAVDNPQNLQEIHVIVDIDSTTNDFQHNAYYYVLRQDDFIQAVDGSETTVAARLTALQNLIAAQFPDSGSSNQTSNNLASFFSLPTASQLPVGMNQWMEGMWKIGDMSRIGTDGSVSLANVKAIAVMVITTGNVTIQFGGWYVQGGFGPDANWNSNGNQGQPIIYRYRYRSSLTGAYSDVSPATRNGEVPKRNSVPITVTASPDPQVNLIDIERNGGTFDTWHRVMTVPNVSAIYTDTVRETIAMAGDPLELLSYTPWPITDKPRTGICNIVGTRVTWVSGDTFNLNWIRGVEIIVNNNTYTLYAPPVSTTQLDTAENIGVLNNVTFIIPEATILAAPLPHACLGPDGRIFATGDQNNPGNLYFSNPYNPDTASDQGYIEITGPGDPLGPPVYFEGAIYVWASGSLYRVDSTPGQVNPYAYYKLGGVTGLAAAWAKTASGPLLAWLGLDGIYVFQGTGAVNITMEELYPLFPFEGRPGLPTQIAGHTFYPPDYTKTANLRLSYADGFLYFDYMDTQGNLVTLAYNLATKGWLPYEYKIGGAGATLHYLEEGIQNPLLLIGGTNGSVGFASAATSDEGTAFVVLIGTPSDDQGETRARKQYGDAMLDYSGTGITTNIVYDNYLIGSITPVPPTRATRGQQVFDLGLDGASLHRNIAWIFSWLSTSGAVLYEWQPSYLLKPEDTIDRPTDWMDGGTMSYKFVHGCRITADTGGVARTVQVQYEGGINGPVLTVNHAGEMTLPYSFPPFKAHLMRLVPTDPNSWRLMAVEWEVDLEPEPTGYWVTQPTSFGMNGYLHIRDIQFAYATVNAGGVLTLVVDGVSYTISGALPTTAGNPVKQYLVAPPIKGKLWQVYCTGLALQVYQGDCEFRIKPWGGQAYSAVKPVGGPSVTSGGARI